ncbi:hypothetical protein [Litoreibacter albidus]|uniref:hypothetical protein n=1 Tax=Litoreibacter albidus TaxID=670155 RepID=UPI0037358E1E
MVKFIGIPIRLRAQRTRWLAGTGIAPQAIFDQIDVGEPNFPEDVRTLIGLRETQQQVVEDPLLASLRQMIVHPDTVSTMRPVYERRLAELEQQDRQRTANDYAAAGGDGEAVYTLTIPSANLPVGTLNLEELTPDQIITLSEDLAGAFDVNFDSEPSVMAALGGRCARAALSLGIRLEQIFQAIGGQRLSTLSAVDKLRLRGVFLREIWVTDTSKVSIVQGRKIISFKGYAGLRVFMSATYYPASSIAVVNAGAVARSASDALRSAAGPPFRGTGGIFLVFGGLVEVASWMSQDGEKFLSDLFIDLTVLVATTVISTIVATALMIGVMAVAGVVTAPALVIGAAVSGVAVLVGWFISSGLDRSGLVESAKAHARSFLAVPQVLYDPDWHPIQHMGPLEGLEYLQNADQEEFGYIMKRGFGLD